ncbi:MAG: glutathione S-transferase family protein [Burkholderiales bacterium]|nr:MAG: glutathione S-transferase family protein [Burkholderiales bacterium]
MIQLHFAAGACSFVPHVGLEVIRATTGAEFEPKFVKLHKGEQKTPEYLAMNPDGQVPVLVVDGKVLTQIVAICDYLDRSTPQAGLLPADSWERAQAMSRLAWMNNTVHPTFTHIYMPYVFSGDEAAFDEMRRFNTERYRGFLGRIQGWLDGADRFMLGDRLSFLDAYALTLLRWGGLSGIDPDDFPAYKAYVDRVASAPPVAAALERERIPVHAFRKQAA